ncbi:UNVERIFIED_CONTAM: hypothetical protein FKN15_063146 [Acipenser sinensis]
MFLKNVPRVVALQTEWRPYGPIGTYSLPICFTDSESDLSTTDTPIPDKVQMIIESLRSTQSSIDMNNDYNDSMQGNHARAKCSDGPTSRETQEVIEKKAMEDAKPVLLSNSDAAEYESLAQDSDSDDSVDRDIEEAIQEYLKKKNDYRAQSIQNNAPCDKVIIRGRAPKKIENAVLPVNTAKKKEEPRDPLRLNTSKRLRCVSSSSASSDDSFDQSIQEEIKRFLTKKKAHAGETHISKKPKSTPPPVKSEKSSAEVRLHFKKNAINRTFVSSNTATTQTTRDPSDNFQIFCKVDENLSDSSSDDGIEEAIQRYQLEKQKEKEGDVFKFSGSTQTQPSLDLCAAQGAHIVKHQKILSRKKKQSGSKPAVSTHNISKDLDTEEVRGNVSPSPETVRFEPTFPLKGNTSAELMCAEAILDISKAVLPTTIQPSVIVTKACTNTSPLPSGDVPYCSENSDSSSVDSDDGIEQEICNFLALKAQMNSCQWSNNCEIEVDECLSDPCQNGATCSDELDAFGCLCPDGIEGVECEIDRREKNRATCIDQPGNYFCQCLAPFKGSNCGSGHMRPVILVRTGLCVEEVELDTFPLGFRCQCAKGFAGPRCEINVSECSSDSCLSGYCCDVVGGFYCLCNSGFAGVRCDQGICDCINNMCADSSTCVDLHLDCQMFQSAPRTLYLHWLAQNVHFIACFTLFYIQLISFHHG